MVNINETVNEMEVMTPQELDRLHQIQCQQTGIPSLSDLAETRRKKQGEALCGKQEPVKDRAKDQQVGGDHYLKMKIQPIDFITENNIPFIEGNIIKYLCRWRNKNGVEDLLKAKHYISLLIDEVTSGKEVEHTHSYTDGVSLVNTQLKEHGITSDDNKTAPLPYWFLCKPFGSWLDKALERRRVYISYQIKDDTVKFIVKVKDELVFSEKLFQIINTQELDPHVYIHRVKFVAKELDKAGVPQKLTFVVLVLCLGCFNFYCKTGIATYAQVHDDIFGLLQTYCERIARNVKSEVTFFTLLCNKSEFKDKHIMLYYGDDMKIHCRVYNSLVAMDRELDAETYRSISVLDEIDEIVEDGPLKHRS